MNVKSRYTVVVAAALLASGPVIAQPTEAPVKVVVDGLSPTVAAKVRDKAAQGPTELRRFVERTRAIYELHYGSIAANEPNTTVARKGINDRLAAR